MTVVIKQIIDMLDMLPHNEQEHAYNIIKKFILVQDPDFTKLTLKRSGRARACKRAAQKW